MIGHYIQTAIMWREEQQISAEMAECEAVIDSLNQNDEEADNAELMDTV